MPSKSDSQRHPVGVGHMHQVHKRRVTDDASVSMEHTGTDKTGHYIHTKCLDQQPDVHLHLSTIYKYKIGEKSCKQQNQQIKYQDTPVWQRFLAEIPVCEFLKWIHIV